MLDTIKNILSGNQYPLLKINRQEGYVFRQFIQDTTSIIPQYSSIYKVKFLNIENHPYKVRYYFRLINNDIYTTLNQFFTQYNGKNSALIQYHHQNFKQAIEEYIGGFYEKIQQQDVSANLLKEPPSTLDEQQMFVIIAYYAIASLACAYFQYLEQFSMSLPTKNLPETPNDFIYETLQSSFPKEIEISRTKQQSAIEHQSPDEVPVGKPVNPEKESVEQFIEKVNKVTQLLYEAWNEKRVSLGMHKGEAVIKIKPKSVADYLEDLKINHYDNLMRLCYPPSKNDNQKFVQFIAKLQKKDYYGRLPKKLLAQQVAIVLGINPATATNYLSLKD